LILPEKPLPKSYAPQFRATIVEQMRSGRLIAEVATELEISQATIFRWVRQHHIDRGKLSGTSTGENAELRAARCQTYEPRGVRAGEVRAQQLAQVFRLCGFGPTPDSKAEVYAELGVDIVYDPGRNLVIAGARPPSACATERVAESPCTFS
jgi:transposase-like protein